MATVTGAPAISVLLGAAAGGAAAVAVREAVLASPALGRWLADEIGERAVLQLLGIGVLSVGALLSVWLTRVNRTSAAAVEV